MALVVEVHVSQDCLLFVSAMGLEKGVSYGTFEGQQGFAQHSAPSLGGAYSSGGQQFATSAVPGILIPHRTFFVQCFLFTSQLLKLMLSCIGVRGSKSGNIGSCCDFLSEI